MDKLDMKTKNIADENYATLAKLFPNALTEKIVGYDEDGKAIVERSIDVDVLRQEISCSVVEGREERYQFTWPNKKQAIIASNAPIYKTLRPVRDESVDFNNTENIYIEGDNLGVLKLLQETYLGKIKMIYIDPPYNTGNDFVYVDSFKESINDYLPSSGQYDAEGNQLVKNLESNGRFHTDWLNMIYPRIKLAKNLLADNGVIFISIDDNEVSNLKKVCDEIFGEHNFIAEIVWEKVHTRKNSAINFSSSHEYILCYAKIKRNNSNDTVGFARNLLPRENNDAYSNPDNDPKGPWKTDPLTAHNYYSADYKITKPNGVVISRPQDRYWAYSEETIKRMIAENAIVWGEGDSMPLAKRYLCDVQDGLVPITLFSREFAGDSLQAKRNLDDVFSECKGVFDYTKPVKLLKRLLQIATKENDIVLDFFSGSGTLAHAMMELNAEDGIKRNFIMVQLPEETDTSSEAYKAGFSNICEIGKERIRRVGAKIDKSSIDCGFRVLKLDSSNMKDIYYNPAQIQQHTLFESTDNIKEDRTPEDLLFQVMLDLGVLLSSKIEEKTIAGKKVFNVADGFLIACFDTDITEETVKAVAQEKPYYAVFRDCSMANDSVATNFEQIFATYSPETVRKVL